MIAWITLFVSSIIWVFIIGFQSRAVNSGQYLVAAPVSFALGFLQVQVLGDVLSPTATLIDTLIYCTGGMVGIVTAIWFHQHILPRFLRKNPNHAQSNQGIPGPPGP